MKRRLIPICFRALLGVLAILSACNWSEQVDTHPDISKDTLTYKYITFKKRAADCGERADSACTVVLMTYPVFDNAPTLNEQILQALTNRSAINQTPDSILADHAENFIKEYEKDSTAKERKISYQEMKNVHVVRQDSGLVALQVDSYIYSGGAHGMSLTNFINWNTQANNKITLRDIFQTEVEYKEMLDTIGERIFRKHEKLKPNESLRDKYSFKDYKFSLNNNFLITPTGLRFLYNVYEIKPYAAGQTTVVIPYKELGKLLKPKTVISQYHF